MFRMNGLFGALAGRAQARTPQGSSPFDSGGTPAQGGMQINGAAGGGIGAGGMSGMAEGMFGPKSEAKGDGSPWGSLVKKASFEFNQDKGEGSSAGPTDEASAKPPQSPAPMPSPPPLAGGFSGFKFPDNWMGQGPVAPPAGPIMGAGGAPVSSGRVPPLPGSTDLMALLAQRFPGTRFDQPSGGIAAPNGNLGPLQWDGVTPLPPPPSDEERGWIEEAKRMGPVDTSRFRF